MTGGIHPRNSRGRRRSDRPFPEFHDALLMAGWAESVLQRIRRCLHKRAILITESNRGQGSRIFPKTGHARFAARTNHSLRKRHDFVLRRSELPTTETELAAIVAAVNSGFKNICGVKDLIKLFQPSSKFSHC